MRRTIAIRQSIRLSLAIRLSALVLIATSLGFVLFAAAGAEAKPHIAGPVGEVTP